MSWGIGVPSGVSSSQPGLPAAEFADAVRAAKIEGYADHSPLLLKQWEDQLEMAKDAALTLFQQLARVDDDATFTASLSGHANHDGAGDAQGYTPSEFIHVTVNRQPPRKG